MTNETDGSSLKAPLVTFAVGLGVGIVGTLILPNLIRPYLPEAIVGAEAQVYGVVTGKRVEADRVLLTLPTDGGTVLATFTVDLPEIDLMIQQGDSVALAVEEYAPFVENPKIARVVTISSPLADRAAQGENGVDSSTSQQLTAAADSAEAKGDTISLPADTSGR